MSDFGATDQRLRRIEARKPGFPLDAMRLVRMAYHLQKSLRDKTNAVLKKYDLADTSYMVLAILYGSADETCTASDLGEACHEKPANLTRVCDDLVARGLIDRKPKPGDRRAVMISLTGQGRELIDRILPAVSLEVTAAYADLTPDEARQFADLSARVLENLNRQA